jgi:hypothetical protein
MRHTSVYLAPLRQAVTRRWSGGGRVVGCAYAELRIRDENLSALDFETNASSARHTGFTAESHLHLQLIHEQHWERDEVAPDLCIETQRKQLHLIVR